VSAEPSFRYSPSNGRLLPLRMRMHFTRRSYLMLLGVVAWKYNPWTGEVRAPLDITSDPMGRMIVPPGGELRAAQ